MRMVGCYGVAKALLTELSEKVGAPYTYIAPGNLCQR